MGGENQDYQPCAKRTGLVAFQKDGTKLRIQRCTEPTAENNGLDVLPSDCAECPVRALVTKAALLTHEYKPPLFADLHTVISTKNDLTPPPQWKPCRDRHVVEAAACCGGQVEHRVCNSVDCFRIGSAVSPEICSSCVYRKE